MTKDFSKSFRQTALNLHQPVDRALASGEREAALLWLVQELFAQGVTKQQLYDAFFNEHLRLRMELREAEEELIADVILDGLSGFCSASSRLLPEEPDAK